MQRHWRRSIVAGGAIVLLACLCICSLMHGRNRVTLANYKRLQYGISADEVLQVLGNPTSRSTMKGYVKGPDFFVLTYNTNEPGVGPHLDFPTCEWRTNALCIYATFSPDNRLISQWHNVTAPNPASWSERLFRGLRRWWGW